MPHYFSIILDKSALQGLSGREAKWLFHHLRVNLPPVFFAEILGDLTKQKNFNTGSGVDDAKMLSSKVDSAFVDLNMDSRTLVLNEIRGMRFEMDGRPLLDAERVRMPDGRFGAYIDQTPMQRVLDRWNAGSFDEMEHEFAKVWRNRLASIDLEKIVHLTKALKRETITTPADVRRLVDVLFFRSDSNHANLSAWLKIVKAPKHWEKSFIHEWKARGRPPAGEFAPYTAHIAMVRTFFYFAVSHHVITTRSSNEIDMEYFDYLPFCRIFSSADNLHAAIYPALAKGWQMFIPFKDLKHSLKEFADYYDALTPDEKSHGSMTYADYPPVKMNNAITQAYDRFMPGWREGANIPRPPRDPAEDARIMEHLRPMMEAIEAHNKKRGRR
jgi:hypothetical protein